MWSIFPDIFVREQRLFFWEGLSLIFGFLKKYLHHFQRRPIPVVKFCLWRNYYYNTRIKLQRIREDYAEYRVNRILIKIINQMHYTTWTFTEYLLFIMINIHVVITVDIILLITRIFFHIGKVHKIYILNSFLLFSFDCKCKFNFYNLMIIGIKLTDKAMFVCKV